MTIQRAEQEARRREARAVDDRLRSEAKWNRPGADDRLAVGQRVQVRGVVGDVPRDGEVLGLARPSYPAPSAHPRWTVEMDEPMEHGRRVVCAYDREVTPKTHT